MSSSIATIALRWSPVGVNGSESRSQRGQLARGVERGGARALAAPRPPAQERDLQQQELVERQPAAAALLVAEVRGVERRGAVGEPLQRPDPRGQRFQHVAHRRPVLVDERRDLHRREALGCGVGRHVLPHRGDLAGLGVLVDAKAAVALVFPGQQQPCPRPVATLEPRLVEERHRHRAGLVGDAGGDERLHAAAPDGARGDRQDLDDDRRDLVHRQLADQPRGAAIARNVVQQLAECRDAKFLPRFLRLFTWKRDGVIKPRRFRVPRRVSRLVWQGARAGELRRLHAR